MRVLSDYCAPWCGNLNRVVFLGWWNRKTKTFMFQRDFVAFVAKFTIINFSIFPYLSEYRPWILKRTERWNNVGKRMANWVRVLRFSFSLYDFLCLLGHYLLRSLFLCILFLKRGMLVSTSIDYWEDWMRLLLQRFSTVIGTLLHSPILVITRQSALCPIFLNCILVSQP